MEGVDRRSEGTQAPSQISEPQAPPSEQRSKVKDRTIAAAVIALIGAVAAAVIALWSAVYTTNVSNKNSTSERKVQVQEDRAKAAREKRAEVYKEFLLASDFKYAEVEAIAATAKPIVEYRLNYWTKLAWPSVSKKLKEGDEKLEKLRIRWEAANRKFSLAREDVSIYGSDEAEAIAGEIEKILPGGLGKFGWLGFKAVEGDSVDALSEQREAFRRLMCRELSAQPRTGCSKS